MLTTNKTIPHNVKKPLSDNWWEDFVLLCGNKLGTQPSARGNWFPREIPWLNSEVWDFHQSDMARWGRRPRSLSSWHKGHCLSAKSSFLRPTSPPILCCTLNRPLILTGTTPYHAWRQASSVCTETEKRLGDFFFFLNCIHRSGSSLASLLPTNLCPAVWASLNFVSNTQACATSPRIDWGYLPPQHTFFSAASAVDRCTVALILWHFHKEMDVVGSVRQQGDIYIRKNGCCQTRGEKEVQKQAHTAVITSPHPHRRFSTVILPDGEPGRDMKIKIIIIKKKNLCKSCRCSQNRKWGDDTRQGFQHCREDRSERNQDAEFFFFPVREHDSACLHVQSWGIRKLKWAHQILRRSKPNESCDVSKQFTHSVKLMTGWPDKLSFQSHLNVTITHFFVCCSFFSAEFAQLFSPRVISWRLNHSRMD